MTTDATPSSAADGAWQGESAFRSLAEQSPDYIMRYDRRGRHLYMNPAGLRVAGLDAADIIGRTHREAGFDPELCDLWEERIREVFETGRPARTTFSWQSAEGPVHLDWQLWPEFGADGTVGTVVGLSRDISDLKRTEAALSAERANFRAILSASPVGMLVFDAQGEVRYANPAAERLFGTALEDLAPRRCGDFLACVHRRSHPGGCGSGVPCRDCSLWAAIRSVLEGPVAESSAGEALVVTDGGGEPVALRFKAGALTMEDHPAAVLALEDVTTQRHLLNEKARLESQYLQSQKLESVGRLAGGVAHDLNNMLVPILGYAEILQEELPTDHSLAPAAREITGAGRRARDLVRQLLAFSRKQTLELETVDLNDVIRRFSRLLRRTIREDIAIETVLGERLRPVRADLGQVEQVLMNLAVNAQDAMPDGGRLIVETDETDIDGDYAAARSGVRPGDYVRLTVTDTGSGMDTDTAAQVFEPFFTTKAKDRGTGLGLATVYGIVKQHGGNVWVYSEPGRGTTFKVYLPVAEGAAEALETPAAPAADLRGTETVLLVEDNPQVRRLTAEMLKRGGYRVRAAENGRAALSLLGGARRRVDLLVTDVIMPDMNGKELFALARRRLPDLRVLYMSGYTANVIAHHGVLDAGVHFIQKPFARRELLARLREVLAGADHPGGDGETADHEP